jgi:DNA-binding CsgD family transcriptional regulator
MLSRPGAPPSGSGWSFELKWDGFRAIVSTENGLRVRSRRGWNMTEMPPELRGLPAGLVLDGELVAWKRSQPYFPLVCRRVLNRDMTVPLTYVVFDVLRRDGEELTNEPYASPERLSTNCGSTAELDDLRDLRGRTRALRLCVHQDKEPELLSSRLRATGARLRRIVLKGLDSLTASDRRIAELASQGLTNREIAQTLFITARTVEGHLTSVFRKLRVHSRDELPAALASGVPVPA